MQKSEVLQLVLSMGLAVLLLLGASVTAASSASPARSSGGGQSAVAIMIAGFAYSACRANRGKPAASTTAAARALMVAVLRHAGNRYKQKLRCQITHHLHHCRRR